MPKIPSIPDKMFLPAGKGCLPPGTWLSEAPVRVPVRGESMLPSLRDGDLLDVVRCEPRDFRRGDLILFEVGGLLLAHRFLKGDGRAFLQMGESQSCGTEYPWPSVAGKATCVIRDGNRVDLETPRTRKAARAIASRCLRRHRIEALCRRLPGALPARILRRLLRPLTTAPRFSYFDH